MRRTRTSSASTAASPKPATPYATDLEYLDELMRWLEARCRRVRAEARLEKGEQGFGSGFEEEDDFADPAHLTWLMSAERSIEKRLTARLDASGRAGRVPAFERLVAELKLDDFERMVLAVAVGSSLSRSLLESVSGLYDRAFNASVSVEVLFVLAGLGFEQRVARRNMFGPRSRLVANDLITVDSGSKLRVPGDLLDSVIEATHRAVSAAVGDDTFDTELLDFSSVSAPMATFDAVVMKEEDRRRVLSVVERHELYLQRRAEWGFDEKIRYGRGVWLLFHGPPGTGKTMTAHAIAHRLGKRVLAVDIPTFLDSHEADRFLPALFREARVQDALLFFDECEVLFASRHYGSTMTSLLLTELERFEGTAILATNLPDLLDEALLRRMLVKVRFTEPDATAREAIWRSHIPSRAPLGDDVDFEALAARYPMSGGYIKNAVLTAIADAVHTTDDGAGPITMTHFERAAAEQMEGRSIIGSVTRVGFGAGSGHG